MPGTIEQDEQVQTPEKPVATIRAEEQDAHDRAVYRRLVSGHSEGEPESGQPAAPVARSKPEQGATTNDQHERQGEPPAGDTTGARELTLIAEAVLKRDGLPEGARKRLLEGATPEEISEIIAKRRKVQQDTDRLGNELAEARRTPKPDPKVREAKESDDLAEGLTQKQAAIVRKLLVEDDEDRAREMAEAFRDGATSQRAGRGNETNDATAPPQGGTPQKGLSPEEAEGVLLVKLQEPLDRAEKQFPALSGISARREVIRSAQKLLEAGVFDDLRDPASGQISLDVVIAKACELRLGGQSPQDRQRSLLERNHKERSGQPAPSSGRSKAETKPTGVDRERQAYALLLDGKSPEEIQRLLR